MEFLINSDWLFFWFRVFFQYRIGYMWSQLQFSKQETGGGSGVEFVEEKKITDPEPGRFTYRIYYLEKFVIISFKEKAVTLEL